MTPSLPHGQLTGPPPSFILRLRQLIPPSFPLKITLSSKILRTQPLPPSSPLPNAINKGSSLRTAKGSNEKDANTYFGSRIHRACHLPQILRVLYVVRSTKLAYNCVFYRWQYVYRLASILHDTSISAVGEYKTSHKKCNICDNMTHQFISIDLFQKIYTPDTYEKR